MNKDKFFKFFEIGKLDKGLFRIWIILLIPYFIFGYLEIKDQNTYYKNFDYNEESVTVSNNDYCQRIEWKNFNDEPAESVTMYGPTVIWDALHPTLGDCLASTKKAKIKEDNERRFVFLLFILAPIILAFILLIIKKTILWIYRGFK